MKSGGLYCTQTIAAAIPSIAEVIGPHNRRSGADGVIQLARQESPCTPSAIQLVQIGHWGCQPAAEVMATAIPSRITTETAAAIRPNKGKAPSC